jgi:hypothetical protein
MPYAADEGNICPCCGTEFGFDNSAGVTFRQLRDKWVGAGTPWFSPLDARPPLWNGVVQLILADLEFSHVPVPVLVQTATVDGHVVAVELLSTAA